MGWSIVNTELGEFVEILPPQKRVGENWYLGTADAVYQNLYSTRARGPRWVIILSGDHIYKMDYGKMLDVHIARGAVLTVGAHRGPARRSRAASACWRWTRTAASPASRRSRPPPPPRPGTRTAAWAPWASTSSTSTCWCASWPGTPRRAPPTTSAATSSPSWSPTGERVYAYLFWDENKKASKYWRDVGTLDAYYEASMDLMPGRPRLQPLRPGVAAAHVPAAVPARQVRLRRGRAPRRAPWTPWSRWAASSPAARSARSILSPGVRVHSYCDIEDSILMPNATIHRHAADRARRSSTARWRCRGAPSSATIPAEDRRRHTVSDGGRGGGHAGRGVLRRPAIRRLGGAQRRSS